MSYYRSYFEKNNTILKDSQANTAKNPTTEIFYGSAYSRFIFKVDFTDLKSKVDDDEFVVTTGTTHTLHLTNTIFGDEGLKGVNRTTGRDRAVSFDLILFKVTQYWDEGLGFDYTDESWDFVENRNKTYDERPSNWYYRTTMNTWSNPGIYDTTPTILQTIHFDNGVENIDVDITNYVNGVLTGDTNHGLGLSFALVYQDVSLDTDQSVAFFTKYTQTFFEPYVESYFDDRIIDNRLNFTEKMDQNLYLYVTKGSNFFNLDTTPTVDITDSNDTVLFGLSGLTTNLVKKGVYKVTFAMSGVTCDGKRFYYDKWKNLSLNGSSISNVTQKFIPKPYTSGFSVGPNQTELQRYVVQFFGIKQLEKINQGDVRKIAITFKSIETSKSILFEEVFYRIYIKEGLTQVIVHDWTYVDMMNENAFYLDTSYLIPREYHMEIKAKTHTEEINYNESIRFEIVSQK